MAAFIKANSAAKTRSRRAFSPMADINVTPMVDVMLVLLVIFIVTAPLLTAGVNVNLPQTKSTKSMPQDNKALTLFVQKDGSLALNENKIEMDALQGRLEAMRQSNPDLRVYVKGDREALYGVMAQVMASVQAAGITQIGFITEPQRKPPQPPQ